MLIIKNLKAFSEEFQEKLLCTLTPLEYMYTRLILSDEACSLDVKSICRIDDEKEGEIKKSVTSKINNMMDLLQTLISNKLITKFGDKETLEAELVSLPSITQYVIIHYYGVNTSCKSLREIAKELNLPFQAILTHYNNGLRELSDYIN